MIIYNQFILGLLANCIYLNLKYNLALKLLFSVVLNLHCEVVKRVLALGKYLCCFTVRLFYKQFQYKQEKFA